MNRGDVTAEVVEHLFIVAEHLREGFDRAAAGADLSVGQAKALRHLAAAGPVAMRDLAVRMHCDASNITGIVDRLEARGLVVRRVADGDRRVKSLVVTADGRRLADAMWRQVCEQAAAVLEMTDEERAALALLLRRAGTRCATPTAATTTAVTTTAGGACLGDAAPRTQVGERTRPQRGAGAASR